MVFVIFNPRWRPPGSLLSQNGKVFEGNFTKSGFVRKYSLLFRPWRWCPTSYSRVRVPSLTRAYFWESLWQFETSEPSQWHEEIRNQECRAFTSPNDGNWLPNSQFLLRNVPESGTIRESFTTSKWNIPSVIQ